MTLLDLVGHNKSYESFMRLKTVLDHSEFIARHQLEVVISDGL